MGEDITLVHNKFLKWKQDLNFGGDLREYGIEHINIYRVTNVPKYRSFQYRLLQRAIITNQHLYKWGKKTQNTCTFCDGTEESLVHLFFECPYTYALWIDFKEYIYKQFWV